MIRTKLNVNINIGGNRTESRTLLFILGATVNGFDGANEIVQFPIRTFKKLTAEEIPVLTYMVGSTPESEGVIQSRIEGMPAMKTSNGDVYLGITQRSAIYKKSTFDTIVGTTMIKDFDAIKYTLMISQIDYVTNDFDNWGLIEQYKVGDYYGLVSDQLEIIAS
ncbi:MAG: hypothetical protein ACI9N9_000102 [Enterobacterales bacterium]|jgi:hypothetical protein